MVNTQQDAIEGHQLTIRLAKPGEAGLIADISRETFMETFATDNSPEDMNLFMNTQFSRTMLEEEVGDTRNFFLLAHIQEASIGYAKLRTGDVAPAPGMDDHIELSRLYVRKPFIHHGIGHRLMEACIATGRRLDKRVIWLGVWEHNHRAIRFYEREGFAKFGERPFLLGSDMQNDWIMRRNIEDRPM